MIFGNIVYDKQGSSDASVNIVLNDIHVDIMDYIKPASCNEAQVRAMQRIWTTLIFSSEACGPNSSGRTRSM